MRISDWSSDVCSSDLLTKHRLMRPLPEDQDGHASTPRRTTHPWARARQAPVSGYRPPDAQWPSAPGQRPTRYGEIGRASCRERVESVRVDLGGRRVIKKQKTLEYTNHKPT